MREREAFAAPKRVLASGDDSACHGGDVRRLVGAIVGHDQQPIVDAKLRHDGIQGGPDHLSLIVRRNDHREVGGLGGGRRHRISDRAEDLQCKEHDQRKGRETEDEDQQVRQIHDAQTHAASDS